MNKEDFIKNVNDPKNIPGIYNYCDRWCERCSFTDKCSNYAISDEQFKGVDLNLEKDEFWNKLGEVFEVTMQMIKNSAKEMGIDLSNIEFDDAETTLQKFEKYVQKYECSIVSKDYIAKVGAWLDSLKDILEEKMENKNLISLFRKIEIPLIKILGNMEINGIKVNIDFLKGMSRQVNTRLGELKKTIYNLSGTEFNINSPKQLSVVLFERLKLPVIKKTKTGYSTNADVLNTLAPQHKVVSFILEYRELEKLKNTYIDKLPSLVNSKTNRIHTSFHQTVTSTGRLSSSEPNLQNIPVRTEMGREIRKAFITEEGFVLLSADYSQIELRILAHLSRDESLLNAFKNDEDIHSHTASGIFNLDQNIISEQMRRMAKVINFGIIYGMSSYGLARNLGVGREEAERYINNYFFRYQGVKRYIEKEKEEARKKGYVLTLLNRRRYLEGINSKDKNIREFNERIAINAPIQGSAADLIKLAMIKIDESFKKERFKSRLLLQIHDELIFEIYQPELEKVKSIIKEIMENSLEISVPIKVNLKTGNNWAQLN